jgi:uncharacterized membrane protein
MESKVKLLGHPVHPILVDFPVALFTTAVLFDLVGLATGSSEFAAVSYWAMSIGLVVGLTAALFGLVDWLAIRGGTRAKRIGAWHGLGNVVVVGLFATSWFLRLNVAGYSPTALALGLSLAGIALALVTTWLGGELVFRLRIGVDENAGANAPSSLGSAARDASGTRDTSHPARVS